MIKPFEPFKIDSNFKEKVSYGLHEGWDLNGLGGGNTDCGTEYRTPGDCNIVYAADSNKDYGNLVVLELQTTNGTRWCRFGHCQTIFVRSGSLKIGTVFATMGTTGNSTACHLHFDVFKKKPSSWRFYGGKAIDEWFEDPAVFFDSQVVGSGIVEDMPQWIKEMFAGLGIDISKPEGEVRGRVQEVIDGFKNYKDLEKRIVSLEKELSGAAGQAAEFEQRLLISEGHVKTLTKSLEDARDSVTARDVEISGLKTRVELLEKNLDPTTKVVISKEEYEGLMKAKQQLVSSLSFNDILMGLFKRLVGRR